jgi:hypothetical protein
VREPILCDARHRLGVAGRDRRSGDLAAGADLGVEPAQIEPVDDGGDRTHLVIDGHLGVEVDPAPGDLTALRALDPHVALRLHRATRPGQPGELVRRTGPQRGLARDPCAGSRPLAAHGPARFQPSRSSQVWARGNATSGAPADEYGST